MCICFYLSIDHESISKILDDLLDTRLAFPLSHMQYKEQLAELSQ